MFVDRVEIAFDAAHRLLNYRGKCASPHGHTFRAEVMVGASRLNPIGIAIDFGQLKVGLKVWIDEHWDHGFLLNSDDVQLVEALKTVPESKLYLFPGVNPSAETMAEALFHQARCQFGLGVLSVRIWESPSQYAEYLPDPSEDQRGGESLLCATRLADGTPAVRGVL